MSRKIRCDRESWKLFGFQDKLNKALFSWWKSLDFITVAPSFVFDNYCPIID